VENTYHALCHSRESSIAITVIVAFYVRYSRVFLVFVVLSCSEPNPVPLESQEKIRDEVFCLDIDKWVDEILYVDSIKINDRIGIEYTHSDIDNISRWINCESIRFESTESTFREYLNCPTLQFEKVYESYRLREIHFENQELVVKYMKMNLSNGTRIQEFCTLFPECCKLTIVNGMSSWSGFIAVRGSESPLDKRKVFLVFKNELLTKLVIEDFK